MAQRKEQVELSPLDVAREQAASLFLDLKAKVEESKAPLAEAKESRAAVKAAERAYLWAEAGAIVLLNDPDARAEAATAVADEVATVRELGDGTRDNYRSRMRWATSPTWADKVMATETAKREKADPMSVVLKLMKSADDDAVKEAAEEARQGEARQHGAEALELMVRRTGAPMSEVAANIASGDKSANDAFNSTVSEVKRRHELKAMFADWRDRNELRDWLAEFSEMDESAEAQAKAEQEKIAASLRAAEDHKAELAAQAAATRD